MKEIWKLEKQINQLDKEIQGIKKNIDNRNRRMEDCEKEKKELQDRIKELKKSKNKRWRAKINDIYFYVNDFGDVNSCHEYNAYEDNYSYKTRNYFKTREEAEEYQEIMNTYYDLMNLAEDLNNGEKIDWNDNQQCKYTIFYNFEDNFLKRTNAYVYKEFGQIYCLDEDFLEKAIEKIGEDKLTKLFTYERN